MTHRNSLGRCLAVPFLAFLPLAFGSQARADDLDLSFRLDDGRLAVRLAGESGDRDGYGWGVLELDREARGEFGWAVPVSTRNTRHRYVDPRDRRRDDLRLRGDWEQGNSCGDWDSYYRDGPDGRQYFGGRVRFVPRERPQYRGFRDGGEWRDYPLPPRRGSRSWDRDRGYDRWDDASRDSRYGREDPRDARDDWTPYDPDLDRRDARDRSGDSGDDDWAPYDPYRGDDW